MTTEMIRWVTDGSLPPENTGMLIEAEYPDGSSMLGEGWREDGKWLWDEENEVWGKIIAWAEMPKGSRACAKPARREWIPIAIAMPRQGRRVRIKFQWEDRQTYETMGFREDEVFLDMARQCPIPGVIAWKPIEDAD